MSLTQAGLGWGVFEVTSPQSPRESVPLHTYAPQAPPNAHLSLGQESLHIGHPLLQPFGNCLEGCSPSLALFPTHMSPHGTSLFAPWGRHPAALFWDGHVLACDRGMNGTFCSAGDKGRLQPPLETPRKIAIFLYSQLLSLKHNSGLMLRVT